jgi:CubicO group peptidase (beta-lactamase class C family)
VIVTLCLTILMACQSSIADMQPITKPTESVGFSSERLDIIAPVMQGYIDQGKLAGTLTLVARNGKIAYLNARGMQDKKAKKPIAEDTIFRIYSMTKPITAEAAMILWEQGKFHMFDPISKYLPELSNMKVYVSGSGDNMIVEEAKTPIRIIDLFTHTSGYSYGFSNSEVDKLYQIKLSKRKEFNRDNILSKFAELPLTHQPGTAWNYGVSTDIIGFLVEKLSAKKLGGYMQDTGFYVPSNKIDRLSQIYTADKTGQTVVSKNVPGGIDFLNDPKIHSAEGD